MTLQEVKRKVRRAVEDCLHNNKQSIIFQTRILRKLESTRVYTRYEVEISGIDKQQKEVLKNKLNSYARVCQISANSWYFFFSK